jgi:glycosyltransferase involved in cell wall biosynthesis
MEKPILLGVEGEAHGLFIEQGKSGLGFEPENVSSLVSRVMVLVNQPSLFQEYGRNGRGYVSENFERNKIAEAFYMLLSMHAIKKK